LVAVKPVEFRNVECPMLAVISLASVLTGATLSYATKWFPSRVATIESCAGTTLLLGFGLLGVALQSSLA